MKKIFLILPLVALLFATQGWAPPPGKGRAPSKINMPKDQPGYGDLSFPLNETKDIGLRGCRYESRCSSKCCSPSGTRCYCNTCCLGRRHPKTGKEIK